MVANNKTISLVLGSGGARGLAHIGIIHWLEEQNYAIRSIAGSSMGALVGGIYAMGKLDEFTQWVKAVDKLEMLRLMDFTRSQGGLVKGDKIINTLAELTGERHIEDLPISFTAVAADIANEKEVWIDTGPVFDAIRASISLPLLFTPVDHKGVTLIDGGVLNPVPIAPTFRDHTDLTIAVNLSGQPNHELDLIERKQPVHSASSYFSKKIDQFIDSISPISSNTESLSIYDVAYQAIDTMQGAVARQKLAAYPPDVVLELPRNICGILEFDRAEEMIEFGYTMAAKQLGE